MEFEYVIRIRSAREVTEAEDKEVCIALDNFVDGMLMCYPYIVVTTETSK